MDNDLRILRERTAAARDSIDSGQGGGEPGGSAAMLAQVAGTLQTTAGVFYKMTPCDVDGDESEGAAATYVLQAGVSVFAANLGTAIPPVGTMRVVSAVGGRLCFQFDG